MNISKLRLYQTALVQMQNNFAEMFLKMVSNKTGLNDFAPPNKLAARAVDKNYLSMAYSPEPQITLRFIIRSHGKISQSLLIS